MSRKGGMLAFFWQLLFDRCGVCCRGAGLAFVYVCAVVSPGLAFVHVCSVARALPPPLVAQRSNEKTKNVPGARGEGGHREESADNESLARRHPPERRLSKT